MDPSEFNTENFKKPGFKECFEKAFEYIKVDPIPMKLVPEHNEFISTRPFAMWWTPNGNKLMGREDPMDYYLVVGFMRTCENARIEVVQPLTCSTYWPVDPIGSFELVDGKWETDFCERSGLFGCSIDYELRAPNDYGYLAV